MAALESKPPPPEEEGAPAEEEQPTSKKEERKKRREERREKREHAILGAFTMQGATYTHVRGMGVKGGHASYAMDFGIGANLSPGFGMYVVTGGLLAAKIRSERDDGLKETDQAQLRQGRDAVRVRREVLLLHGRRRRRVQPDPSRGRVGQHQPGPRRALRLMGKIPLPKKLYIGIGIAYEFGPCTASAASSTGSAARSSSVAGRLAAR